MPCYEKLEPKFNVPFIGWVVLLQIGTRDSMAIHLLDLSLSLSFPFKEGVVTKLCFTLSLDASLVFLLNIYSSLEIFSLVRLTLDHDLSLCFIWIIRS